MARDPSDFFEVTLNGAELLANNPPLMEGSTTWPPIPASNPFPTKLRAKPTPIKVVSALEEVLYSAASINRAWAFTPNPQDVVVASAPCGGSDMISRLCRLILSDSLEQDIEHHSRSVVPCIESRLVDNDPSILHRLQTPHGSVFQTTMSCSAVARHCSEARRIAVMRHPLDVRAAWVHYLRACWEVPGGSNLPAFDSVVTCDDYVDLPLSLCDNSGHPPSLEEYLSDWLFESKANPDSCLVVFYERVLEDASGELDRIASFLGRSPLSPEAKALIVADITPEPSPPGCGLALMLPAQIDALRRRPSKRKHAEEPTAFNYAILYQARNNGATYPYPAPVPSPRGVDLGRTRSISIAVSSLRRTLVVGRMKKKESSA